jgi:hypothetical protein
MPSQIKSFIDTLQERRPFRGAFSGMLGLPRGSAPLGPDGQSVEAEPQAGMTLPGPPGPAMRQVSTEAAGEALPPPETIATPPPVDERQPYRGMGILEAMYTPVSEAIDRQRRRGPGQPQQQQAGPAGLAGTIRAITDDAEMPATEKLNRLADVTAMAAVEAAERGENDKAKALMRISEDYITRATRMDAVEATNRTMLDVADKANQRVGLQRDMLREQTEAEERLRNLDYQNTERLNEQIARLTRESQSRATAFGDEQAPLEADPALPVEIYARQMEAAARAQNLASNPPINDPAGEAAAKQNAYLAGLAYRIGQHVGEAIDNGAPLFDKEHPGFPEFYIFYQNRLRENPGAYDQLRSELTAVIGPPIFARVRKAGLPYGEAAGYIEGLTGEILGPKPESGSWLQFPTLFGTEAFTQ